MKDNHVNKIEDVMKSAFSNIRSLVDVDIVVGKTIFANSLMILPLSKVTMGFICGGGEYYSDLKEIKKDTEYPFSGGSGAGVSLQPIGFLVIDGKEVNLIKIEQKTAIEKLIETVPEVARFITKNLGKKSEDE